MESLQDLTSTKFEAAKSSQALIFSDTRSCIIKTTRGISLQLRYCPALAKKPDKSNNSTFDGDNQKFDPFANPIPDLLVTTLSSARSEYNLVLNKFPVIANHIILATKEDKSQTSFLEPDDLYAAYSVLLRWKSDAHEGPSLFAFFNSGDHSGASQAHRHIQFLPVESIRTPESSSWDLLSRSMSQPLKGSSGHVLHNSELPFEHFAVDIAQPVNADNLYSAYIEVTRLGAHAAQTSITGRSSSSQVLSGPAPFSYNLSMTTEKMVVMPRKAEGAILPSVSDSSISVNGTILAGTIMVKSEDAFHALQKNPELVDGILCDIGFARNYQ